jgi:DNA modification methylase
VWAKATSGQVREGSVMPSSVTDRFSPAFEYIFMLTKSVKYYFDQYGVKETISNSSISRLNQDIENQIGTTKANGGKKNNGNFKAVGDIESGLVNMRNVWRINLQPGSNGQHIAGYPEKLVEPCIKTATSKKGNCVECGNPYERVLEKDGVNDQNSWNRSGAIDKLKTSKGIHGKTSTFLTDTTTNYKHIGWQKTCKCQTNDISLPIVLDPFMGSGTTALVALKNGCDFIGFELNPEYIEIANKRISPYMNINKFY